MYQRILVPIDFSEYGRQAMDHAVLLARAVGAELVLFHAFDRPTPPKFPATDKGLRDYLDRAYEEASTRLEALAKGIEGVPARAVCTEGRPWSEILSAAKREGCDLVCMSSHGRGALADVLVGGVTEKVLHRSTVPVLVVRPPKIARASDQEVD